MSVYHVTVETDTVLAPEQAATFEEVVMHSNRIVCFGYMDHRQEGGEGLLPDVTFRIPARDKEAAAIAALIELSILPGFSAYDVIGMSYKEITE